ncbi:hypothetical protein L917_15732 [Phytophthora nicotianae]|uniref:START domain-containing protein n=1 Tax=Phytophthora nicotianae TaxID=4792 RepID=W2KH49_PHYNI|nr:hypothetical protein L917_15732 [Phytophthora nicotianae]
MNTFKASLDDASTIIGDVMEFVDTMHSGDSNPSATESLGSESDSIDDASHVAMVRTAPEPQHMSAQQKAKKPDRRKQGPVPYTTGLQRRKRIELLTLRQEAQRLNELLAQLQQRRHEHLAIAADSTTGIEGSNGWRSLAAIECEGREQAERTNRELKVILANQQKTGEAIRKILRKRGVLEGRNFVFQVKPVVERFPSRLDYSDAILGELASGLESLRLDAEMIFPTIDDKHCTIISHSRDKMNASNGHHVAEVSTITPLACSMQNAGDLLWRFVSTDVDSSFYSIRKTNPYSFEMNCVAKSRDGPQNIDGVVIYRRYDEHNSIVVVGRSTWFLPTGGLQFEDTALTVISPSSSDPLRCCTVQTRYELQAKITDLSVLPSDFAQVENAVMSSVGRKLRNAMQALQNALLSEVELGSCQALLT